MSSKSVHFDSPILSAAFRQDPISPAAGTRASGADQTIEGIPAPLYVTPKEALGEQEADIDCDFCQQMTRTRVEHADSNATTYACPSLLYLSPSFRLGLANYSPAWLAPSVVSSASPLPAFPVCAAGVKTRLTTAADVVARLQSSHTTDRCRPCPNNSVARSPRSTVWLGRAWLLTRASNSHSHHTQD